MKTEDMQHLLNKIKEKIGNEKYTLDIAEIKIDEENGTIELYNSKMLLVAVLSEDCYLTLLALGNNI